MPRLLLVRHGITEFNSARRFAGYSDMELSAEGYEQVEKLRDRLAGDNIDAAYSSDLKRAMLTAETIASKHQLEVTIFPELRELNYGNLDGLTFEQIKCLDPEVAELCVNWSPKLKFPEGESVDELSQRVSGFLDRLKQHPLDQTMLIVTHGGPLRMMLCLLLGIETWHWRQVRIDLASLSIVDIYPEIAILSLLNDTSHLK